MYELYNMGSKSPDTALLESAQVPSGVRIFTSKPFVDLTHPYSLDRVRRFYLVPADYPDSGALRSDAFLFLLTHGVLQMNNYPLAHHTHAAHHTQRLQLTRNFLTDGYISCTFSPEMAKFFLIHLLFKVANSESIEAIRDPNGSGAYFVFNLPSHFCPAPLTINGRGAWVLDYNVRSGGSVVPQELWVPQGQGDRGRYVGQTRLRMPIFFVGINGSPGVPVLNAAAGDMQLRDTHLPPPLQDKTTTKIRTAVRALFLFQCCAFPHHLLCGDIIVAGLWSFRISSSA